MMGRLQRLLTRRWKAHPDEPLREVSADQVRVWMASGDTLLVDIRETEEHRREALPGALSSPLSRFPERLATPPGIKRVIFHCQSGRRTRHAGARLAAATELPAYSLIGGLQSWGRVR